MTSNIRSAFTLGSTVCTYLSVTLIILTYLVNYIACQNVLLQVIYLVWVDYECDTSNIFTAATYKQGQLFLELL